MMYELIISQLRQIVLRLTGNRTSISGILHGNTGIAIFFFQYAQYTKNNVYNDYALELISGVQSGLTLETPVNYAHGLCGIGSGIEYMIRQGFIDGDSDEILEDFDNHLFFILNSNDLSFDELIDIGRYFCFRITLKAINSIQQKIILSLVEQICKYLLHNSVSSPITIRIIHELNQLCPCKILGVFLNNYTDSFQKTALDYLPLAWQYVFSLLADSTSEFQKVNTKIREEISGDINRYFNLKSCNLSNGNTAYIIWSMLTGSVQQDIIRKCLENSFSLPNTLFNDTPSNIYHTGILNGYAGTGLTLLSYLEHKNLNWLSLI